MNTLISNLDKGNFKNKTPSEGGFYKRIGHPNLSGRAHNEVGVKLSVKYHLGLEYYPNIYL